MALQVDTEAMLERCQQQLIQLLSVPSRHYVVITQYSKKSIAIFDSSTTVDTIFRRYNEKQKIFVVNPSLARQGGKCRGWLVYSDRLRDLLKLLNDNNVSYENFRRRMGV
jgi:hypothetical protein